MKNITENAKIKTLRLFGADIAEFSINLPEDSGENVKFAASELAQLIKKATGVELITEVGQTSAGHKIVLRTTDDGSLGCGGYRYFEERGNLVIEGAAPRGCMNGVYRFLQNECGWRRLIFGDSELMPADLIDIPAGICKSETPAFDYFEVYKMFWGDYATDRTVIPMNDPRNSYGPVTTAMHGIHRWLGIGGSSSQPCYSSDEVYETVRENVFKYLDECEAAGKIPGVHIKEIDISQNDNWTYCDCEKCRAQYEIDGSSAGAVVKFANRLDEDIRKKYTAGPVGIKIFAYFETKVPPKVTKANDNVYVTFAMNGNCSNHPLDGSKCTDGEEGVFQYYHASNIIHSKWLEGWCKCAKNVYAWYYTLDSVLHQYTILDLIKPDFSYMKKIGVTGIFWQIPYHGFGIKRVEQQLGAELNWRMDMTDEEYERELCVILEHEYGRGWQNVREYIKILTEAQRSVGYYDCWYWAAPERCTYDVKFMRENYRRMADLLEEAIDLAQSEEQKNRCKLLSCHIYYEGAYSSYFKALADYDAAATLKLSAEYDFMIARVRELGFDIDSIISIDGYKAKVYPTLAEEAENHWAKVKDQLEK